MATPFIYCLSEIVGQAKLDELREQRRALHRLRVLRHLTAVNAFVYYTKTARGETAISQRA